MNRSRLYSLLLAACVGGFGWLGLQLTSLVSAHNLGPNICLFRNVAHIPCPSCGTTRSALAILNGNFAEAFSLNPLGFLIVGILFIAPTWIILDLLRQSPSFWNAYRSVEETLSRKIPAIIGIGLILTNWIWNIIKAV